MPNPSLKSSLLDASFLSTFAVRLCILLFGFATSIITARFLGPAGRGSYFYIITLATMIAQFGNLGMQTSNTYLVAKKPELFGRLLINSVWLSLLAGCLGTGLWFVAIPKAQHSFSTLNGLQILLLAPNMIFFLLAPSLLIGLNHLKIYNLFQLLGNLSVSLLLIITGFISAQMTHFIWATLIGWTLTNICLYYSLRRLTHTPPSLFSLDTSLIKESLHYNLKIFLGTLLGFFVLKSSVLIIQAKLNDSALGYFSIASQLNDTLAILPTTLGLLLFPALIKAKEKAWVTLHTHLLNTFLVMLLICLLAFLLVKPFVLIAFGKSFLPAADLLRYLLPCTFFYALTTMISQYLAAHGFPWSQVFTWALALLLVIVLNYWLLPVYGINGAAFALSMTYAFIFIVLYLIAVIQKIKQPYPLVST